MAQHAEQNKDKSNPKTENARTTSTGTQQEHEHVAQELPEEEIGNVTAGFSDEPDREEEGMCKDDGDNKDQSRGK